MRQRLPSPALAVAFVALLAALTGTAVALPGNNVVTGGDITNGAVKTADIRNSTVRGRDVRNNTLTGSDINESRLGTLPRAGTAGAANTANAANIANLAGFAGSVARRTITGQVGAQEGQLNVPIASAQGFRLEIHCYDVGPGAEAYIMLENVSAGDEAQFDANPDGSDEDDLQQGDEAVVVSEFTVDHAEDAAFAVIGPGGEVLHGHAILSVASDEFGGAGCIAAAVLNG